MKGLNRSMIFQMLPQGAEWGKKRSQLGYPILPSLLNQGSLFLISFTQGQGKHHNSSFEKDKMFSLLFKDKILETTGLVDLDGPFPL